MHIRRISSGVTRLVLIMASYVAALEIQVLLMDSPEGASVGAVSFKFAGMLLLQ